MRALALSLALALSAQADEVVLKNGSAFSGIVREEGDRVVVEMDFGTMAFKKIDVRSISRGNDPISEFETRAKSATDVKGMLELAAWARLKGLGSRATDLYRRILTLDADQADARKALGYQKVAGQWLEGDDLMMARGFVKFRGRWYTKDMAERLMHEEELALQENERLELAKRIADQRHNEELTRIGQEQQRLEMERQGLDRWGWRNGWVYAPSPMCGFGYFLPATLPPPQPIPLSPPSILPQGPPSPVPLGRPR
ncbi:MAG TPA: hypothetical protein VKW04_09990 [Planctomycetota bacterium]|nr:hypothetical protein [Planctomycetota bacterium]